MRLLPAGRDALLADLDGPDAVDTVRARVRDAVDAGTLPDVVEVVPAARTVLVTVRPEAVGALGALRRFLDGVDPAAAPPAAARGAAGTVELPVRYDGADLELVAADAGLSVREVAAAHHGAEYTVAFGGFAPGFGYLRGLPAALRQPRLATPRTRIPAGAVGVAGDFSGVYPRASPGGWRLIGRLTDDAPVLFDPHRDPPALLTAGTAVRFRDAG